MSLPCPVKFNCLPVYYQLMHFFGKSTFFVYEVSSSDFEVLHLFVFVDRSLKQLQILVTVDTNWSADQSGRPKTVSRYVAEISVCVRIEPESELCWRRTTGCQNRAGSRCGQVGTFGTLYKWETCANVCPNRTNGAKGEPHHYKVGPTSNDVTADCRWRYDVGSKCESNSFWSSNASDDCLAFCRVTRRSHSSAQPGSSSGPCCTTTVGRQAGNIHFYVAFFIYTHSSLFPNVYGTL